MIISKVIHLLHVCSIQVMQCSVAGWSCNLVGLRVHWRVWLEVRCCCCSTSLRLQCASVASRCCCLSWRPVGLTEFTTPFASVCCECGVNVSCERSCGCSAHVSVAQTQYSVHGIPGRGRRKGLVWQENVVHRFCDFVWRHGCVRRGRSWQMKRCWTHRF